MSQKITASPTRRRWSWNTLRWLICTVLAIAIPLGTYFWTKELERTTPQRQLAAQEARTDFLKTHPECVKQPESAELSDDTRYRSSIKIQSQVACPEDKHGWASLSGWLKITLILLLVAIVILVVLINSDAIFGIIFDFFLER